jgi:tripartite-type tricarboxylate transporter receptor subunit TctC
METSRRKFLQTGIAAAALPVLPRIAAAQLRYPNRPVRILTAVTAGGTTDLVARILAQWFNDKLGQPFVVEDRPGGATNIATEAAVRAPPDGYTLFMANTSGVVNVSLFPNIGFNFATDLAPVACSLRSSLIMLVNPAVPAKTPAELIAYAKANPGKINMASGGKGSTGHVSGELFQMMAGLKFQHVPYRGEAAAMPDLVGGQVQLMFATTGTSMPHVRTGKLRALAVTTTERALDLPNTPPLGDTLKGYESSSWSGLVVPKNTPVEIINLLNKTHNEAVSAPAIRAKFINIGGPPFIGSPADFKKLIDDDVAKWAKVVKATGMTAD